MEVTVHHQTSGERVVTRGLLLVRVLDGGTTTVEDVDRACVLIDWMLERYPTVALVVIVEHGTPLVPLAVNRYAAERFGSYGARLVTGVCLLGLGFWAKAALNSMLVVLRFTDTNTVLIDTSLENFARQMVYELVGLDPDELVAFFEQQRAHLRAHRELVV